MTVEAKKNDRVPSAAGPGKQVLLAGTVFKTSKADPAFPIQRLRGLACLVGTAFHGSSGQGCLG